MHEKKEARLDEALDGLDQDKRDTLRRLVRGTTFAAPVVASFAMQGISINPAHAQIGSSANHTAPSDRRLKRDIERVGTHENGVGLFRFKYLWSDTPYIGVMAQDVVERFPEAVRVGPGDFMTVDYAALGMTMTRDGAAAV
jgi:endosialidase-like protein